MTTDAGSVSEAVSDGETGFVVPIGDAHALASALRRLFDDPGLAQKLGTRARSALRSSSRPSEWLHRSRRFTRSSGRVGADRSEGAGEHSRKGGSD